MAKTETPPQSVYSTKQMYCSVLYSEVLTATEGEHQAHAQPHHSHPG